jgi:hypothetical protein
MNELTDPPPAHLSATLPAGGRGHAARRRAARRRATTGGRRLLAAGVSAAAAALLGAASFAQTAHAGTDAAADATPALAVTNSRPAWLADGKWSWISSGTDSATEPGIQLGLARTPNGILHVIWNRGVSPTTIYQTLISAKGSDLGTTTVATDWDGNGGLALIAMPNHTLRLFASGGYRSGLGAHFVGVNTFTAPESGASWTRASGVVWGGVFAGSEIAATLEPGGQVVSAYSDNYHVGLVPYGRDPVVHPDMANPQLATDQATGAVVYGGITIAGKGGTFVQQILPSPGPALLLGSLTWDASAGLAARVGGGVYIVTANGNAQTLALTRYGGPTVKVAVGGGYTRADVFAAPDGRMWIAWYDFRGTAMYVTRSNNAVTEFEPVQTLDLPSGAGVSGIQGESSLGPLDLFADMSGIGNATGFLYTRVQPVMTASAAAVTVMSKPTVTGQTAKVLGYALKITVTDAGDPVVGATVTAGAKHATTGKLGSAGFAFGATTAGPLKVTVTDPAYQTLTTSARL